MSWSSFPLSFTTAVCKLRLCLGKRRTRVRIPSPHPLTFSLFCLTDKSKAGACLKLCGVSIPAASILRREEDLYPLTVCIPDSPQGKKRLAANAAAPSCECRCVLTRFRLVTRAKPVGWAGVRWAPVDDARLLVGVYQYGLGNWETVRDDPDLSLADKVLPGPPTSTLLTTVFSITDFTQ